MCRWLLRHAKTIDGNTQSGPNTRIVIKARAPLCYDRGERLHKSSSTLGLPMFGAVRLSQTEKRRLQFAQVGPLVLLVFFNLGLGALD